MPRSLASALAVVAVAVAGCRGGCAADRRLAVVGDSYRHRAGERLPPSPLLADGVVRLRGVRGETLGVQVLVAAAEEAWIELTLPSAIAAVQGFAIGAITVQEPSTAMYGPSRGPGTYDDPLTPQPDRVRARPGALFDLAIASDAAPGIHHGQLRIGEQRLPIELRIDRATIDLATAPLVWIFYASHELARRHGLADDDSPAQLEIERRYAALVRAHGAYLATDLPPARFAKRRDLARGVAFWPVAIDSSSDEALASSLRGQVAAFAGLGTRPFFILLDEPHTAAERATARRLGERVAAAGGGVLRAITTTPTPDLVGAVDVWISPRLFPAAAAERRRHGERAWTYNGWPPEAGGMTLDSDGTALRTWGWLAFRYDVELWYAWEGLYYSDRYNGGRATDVMNDPLTFDERRRGGEDFGNGNGVLVYPGPLPSLRLKAMRRGLQDRLLLRRLADCGGGEVASAIAARLVPRGLGEAGARASWPGDEATWEAARSELLDAIDRRCGGAAVTAIDRSGASGDDAGDEEKVGRRGR